MNTLINVLLFFLLLVVLMAFLRDSEGFRGGGEAIGGRTAGPAATSLEEEEEGFRGGGGGQAIGGRTAGPNNIGDLGEAAEYFSEQKDKNKRQIAEAFTNVGPKQSVSGVPETEGTDGPAPASLDEPRQPYNLLSDWIPNAPRGSIGCLRAGCCNETDFEARTNLTGNYLQRTNNYKRAYPDNCTGPLHEFTMSFYKTSPLTK
jgi:hypothetical protein